MTVGDEGCSQAIVGELRPDKVRVARQDGGGSVAEVGGKPRAGINRRAPCASGEALGVAERHVTPPAANSRMKGSASAMMW